MPNDQDPITRAVLREELTAFAENLRPAFHAIETQISAVESRLEARLDARLEETETKLLGEIHRAEMRLTERIETNAIKRIEIVEQRLAEIERKLNPPQ